MRDINDKIKREERERKKKGFTKKNFFVFIIIIKFQGEPSLIFVIK